MSIELFEHNRQAYDSAVAMLAAAGKACVIHPTGTGKSFIGFMLCEDNPEKTVCWLSPSDYIFRTQLENLAAAADCWEPENITFFTYAKLMNMTDSEIADIKPDYIILDEFHRCGAQMWGEGVQRLLAAFPDVPILGLSATAIRYLDDQRNMAQELFDSCIASEMTLGEAIVRGILAPPKYVLSMFSYQKDLSKYETRIKRAKYKAIRDEAGKYLDALKRALENAEGLDVIFDKHMTDRHGKYILFTTNYEHLTEYRELAQDWFSRIDSEPHIYSVYTPDPSTSAEFDAFKEDSSGHLKLLFCIDALNEGIHIPDISGVILMRPTVSPIIFKQQIGRALSASTARVPVIFDIVNNIENLYSIDSLKEEMETAIAYYRSHSGESEVINDSFEIIDKLNKLGMRWQSTYDIGWERNYTAAKAYFDEYGDLLVPADYISKNGVKLGKWEKTSRWEKNYQLAKKYYDENGSLNIQCSQASGLRSLQLWLNKQKRLAEGKENGRQKGKVLTPEQRKKLEAIGLFRDGAYESKWKEQYAEAKAYFSEHHDLNAAPEFIGSNGKKLYSWLNRHRNAKREGKLSNEHIKLLDAIGMVW